MSLSWFCIAYCPIPVPAIGANVEFLAGTLVEGSLGIICGMINEIPGKDSRGKGRGRRGDASNHDCTSTGSLVGALETIWLI
eukprot:2371646-Rhodomonas_salina.1